MENTQPASSEMSPPRHMQGLRLSSIELRMAGVGEVGSMASVNGPQSSLRKPHNLLRPRDRVFATLGAEEGRPLWLEVVDLTPVGYQAVCLFGHPSRPNVDLSFAGEGFIDGRPVLVESVDTGHRLAPSQGETAVAAYLAFRALGLALSLEAYGRRSRPSTNQVFLNSHPQAIATLSLGQFFMCASDVWVVVESAADGIVGQRMSNNQVVDFSRLTGRGITSPQHCIQAAIMSEADYDHGGWHHEIQQYEAAGMPAVALFDTSPGALSRVEPGAHLLLSALMTGRESVWEVVSVEGPAAVIRHGSDLGKIDFSTGMGAGAAVSASFRAVIANQFWCHGDIGKMFQRVLMFT